MKKRENLADSSKLDPLIFSLFFYPLRGCDHASVIGLPRCCAVAPMGDWGRISTGGRKI